MSVEFDKNWKNDWLLPRITSFGGNMARIWEDFPIGPGTTQVLIPDDQLEGSCIHTHRAKTTTHVVPRMMETTQVVRQTIDEIIFSLMRQDFADRYKMRDTQLGRERIEAIIHSLVGQDTADRVPILNQGGEIVVKRTHDAFVVNILGGDGKFLHNMQTYSGLLHLLPHTENTHGIHVLIQNGTYGIEYTVHRKAQHDECNLLRRMHSPTDDGSFFDYLTEHTHISPNVCDVGWVVGRLYGTQHTTGLGQVTKVRFPKGVIHNPWYPIQGYRLTFN